MTRDQTNEISTGFRRRAVFFAWFKDLISITSVYNGSDKGRVFEFNTAAFHHLWRDISNYAMKFSQASFITGED